MSGMKLHTPKGIRPPKEGAISGGAASAILPTLTRRPALGKRKTKPAAPPPATHSPKPAA